MVLILYTFVIYEAILHLKRAVYNVRSAILIVRHTAMQSCRLHSPPKQPRAAHLSQREQRRDQEAAPYVCMHNRSDHRRVARRQMASWAQRDKAMVTMLVLDVVGPLALHAGERRQEFGVCL
jgi:hypothetical protein